MRNLRLNRLSFWIIVAIYFAIKIPLGQYVMANLDNSQNFLAKLDTPLVIALAICVGARFTDAGLNRWIGIGATFFITVVLPLPLAFGYLAAFPQPGGATLSKQEFMELFSMVSLVPLVLLIALLIWAGTRPTSRPELLA
jgi:hypothetical protein